MAAALLATQLTALEQHVRKGLVDPAVQCIGVTATKAVCAVEDRAGGRERTEVVLYRVAGDGRVRVLSKVVHTNWWPDDIELRDVLHSGPPEVVVHWCCAHAEPTSMYRVSGSHIREIAKFAAYPRFVSFDEDGDGVDEIVESGCCDNRECATGATGIRLMKFNGTTYAAVRGGIIDFARPVGAGTPTKWMFAPQRGGRFILHVLNARGVRKLAVLMDGKPIPGATAKRRHLEVPIAMDGNCPEFVATAEGAGDAAAWVWIEEAPAP